MNENIEKLFDLKGKVVIITGGAGMLGTQYAELFSDAGAHVIIADIKKEESIKLAEKITQRNNIKAVAIETDVSKEESVEAMHKQVLEEFGKVDVLINNAVERPKDPYCRTEDFTAKEWNKLMSVNLEGIFICSKIIGGEMAKKGKGVIINIGSKYGFLGKDDRIYGERTTPPIYCAAKGGVINLTRALATYWAKKRVRVNCLSPGGVRSNQGKNFLREYHLRVPLGRMADRSELKGPILFLASDASSYMTGANLIVDGGYSVW